MGEAPAPVSWQLSALLFVAMAETASLTLPPL